MGVSQLFLGHQDDAESPTGGKSAILTAIAIAFGGKAAQTGRGSGIRDLIMKGAE